MDGSIQEGAEWMPDHVRVALIRCLRQRSARRITDTESVGSLKRQGSGSSVASSFKNITGSIEKDGVDGFKLQEISPLRSVPRARQESSEDFISDMGSETLSFMGDPESMKVVRLEGCKSEIGSVTEDAWIDDDMILRDAQTEIETLKTRLSILQSLVAEAIEVKGEQFAWPPSARTETSISSTGLPTLCHQNSMSSLASHNSRGRTMGQLARIEGSDDGSSTTDSNPPKAMDVIGGKQSAILITPQSRCTFDSLSDGLVARVMSFLSVIDVTRLSMTCTKMRRVWRESVEIMVLGDSTQSGHCPCSTSQYLEGKKGYPHHHLCPFRPFRTHDDYDLRLRRRSILPAESSQNDSNQMFVLTNVENAICSWGLNTKLTCLEIHSAPITDNVLLLLSKLDYIKRLGFVRCHQITQGPLRSTLAKMHSLEVLIVDHCKQVNPLGLMDVVSRKVKTLELTSKQPIDDAQLNMFTTALMSNDFGACEVDELALVTASTEKCISNITLKHFFNAGIKHLRALHLHCMLFMDDAVFKMIGEYMDRIEVLSVAHCPNYTNEGLKYISQKLTLRSLDLTGNTNIDEEGVSHLIGLRNLKILVLADTSVDTECVERLSVMTNLEVLDLRGCDVILYSRAALNSVNPVKIFAGLNPSPAGASCDFSALTSPEPRDRVPTIVTKTLSVSGRRYSAVRKSSLGVPSQSGPLSTMSSTGSSERPARGLSPEPNTIHSRTLRDIAANNYDASDLQSLQ